MSRKTTKAELEERIRFLEDELRFSRDIIDAVNELHDSHDRYRRITEAVTDYIFTVQYEYGQAVETVHGPACVAVTGYTSEEFANDPYLWIRMVPVEDHGTVNEQIRLLVSGQEALPIEHRIVRKDGTVCWVRSTLVPHRDQQGRLLSYDGLIRDITDLHKAEKRKEELEYHLRQAYKMDALGTLAGGIAHEFNNLLGIIIGNADIALDDIPDDNIARQSIERIQKASYRARDVVLQILAFCLRDEQPKEPLPLCHIIKEELSLLRSVIPAGVSIEQDIDMDCRAVLADPLQIHQVLINLCDNAVHAMDEKGTLSISLKEVELGSGDLAQWPNMAPGTYARLSVGDTGAGIEKAIIERIFDPFYTTKKVGVGTGMGLAVVHGIVESHGGRIMVESEPGRGTVFHADFPTTRLEEIK